MKHLDNETIIKDNRLVKRVWTRNADGTREILSQGKRVGKDCPLSQLARIAYVKGGAIAAAVQIRKEQPDLSLRQIVDLIKSATGTGGL
jgi:hypothetical protein